jgi:hypothetical protein
MDAHFAVFIKCLLRDRFNEDVLDVTCATRGEVKYI